MHETTPKERMLKKIRKALIEKRELPYPKLEENGSIYRESNEALEVLFAEAFTRVNGQFVYCENEVQFKEDLHQLVLQKKWKAVYCWEEYIQSMLDRVQVSYINNDTDFEAAEVGITGCEVLAARTGSILLSSATASGRRLSVYPHIHIVIAYTSQLKEDIKDALQFVKDKYEGKLPSMLSLTTGPSRTADIEKTLVLGAHGPREIYLFLIEDHA